MSNLVIVAIPEENDYVWKLSSEEVPHMTLLFLGELNASKNVTEILNFVQHAAVTTLEPFHLEVLRRGVLGKDEADVVYLGGWGLSKIAEFRGQLLKNTAIRNAYDSVEQFDGWTPHLTMGYPESPAKPDTREYPGLSYISFNRIAVWINDYDGPTTELVYKHSLEEVSMSATAGKDAVEAILQHHGVKGMKWGVRGSALGQKVAAARAAAKSPKPVEVETKPSITGKTKIKTAGGSHQPAHPDAINAAASKQKLHASGTHALSNKELQDLATRMNLERQVTNLAGHKNSGEGKKVVENLLKDEKVQKEAKKHVANHLAKKMAAKAAA